MSGEVDSVHKAPTHAEIIDYYDECWLSRFERGHNPESLAAHFGLHDAPGLSSERAKLRTNDLVASLVELPVDRPATILDAGCGVGGTMLALAAKAGSWRVVGVNISASQARFARERAIQAGLAPRVDVLVGDYCEVPLPSGAIDAVVAVESLCHCAQRPRFLRECRRLLRKGGRLVVIDFGRADPSRWNAAARRQYARVKEGFRIFDYYDAPLTEQMVAAGLGPPLQLELTSLVMPDLSRSAARARHGLRASPSSACWRAHFQTCISLHQLCTSGHLRYYAWSAAAS